jgi:hypothetical protein
MQATMAFKLDRDRVRLVLVQGERELLRASLPPPAQFWSTQPVRTLLEGLATWLDTSLRVVFAAADPADGWSLALTGELGVGCRTVLYEVVPVPERGRLQRQRAVDDFRDLRQLCLLDRIAGGGR